MVMIVGVVAVVVLDRGEAMLLLLSSFKAAASVVVVVSDGSLDTEDLLVVAGDHDRYLREGTEQVQKLHMKLLCPCKFYLVLKPC